MKTNYTAIITPIASRFFNKNAEILFKIIRKSSRVENIYLKNVILILEFLQENRYMDLKYEDDNIRSLNIIFDIEAEQFKLLYKFLISENLIIYKYDKLDITDKGKLFLLCDSFSQTLELIRYFWEKLDWEKLCRDNGNNFLTSEGKRYIASVFSQINWDNTDIDIPMGVKMNGRVLFWNLNRVLFQIINDSSTSYIIKEILVPLGLIKLVHKNDAEWIFIDETSKLIFNYYSQGMVDEYNHMLDECWDSYDRGNFQEAFDNANGILKVVDNVEAYNVIGCVYIKRREYDKAKETFNYAISLLEKQNRINTNDYINIDLYISLYFNLGLCHYYTDDLIKALHIFMEIRNTLPYTLEKIEEIIYSIKDKIVLNPMNNS